MSGKQGGEEQVLVEAYKGDLALFGHICDRNTDGTRFFETRRMKIRFMVENENENENERFVM
jgi:hypothetical protein